MRAPIPRRGGTTAAGRRDGADHGSRQDDSESGAHDSSPGHLAINLLRAGLIQAKLVVSRADDPLEAEADRMADRALRPDHAGGTVGDIHSAGGPHQDGTIARKPIQPGVPPWSQPPSAPDGLLRQLGSGEPMDAPARAFFEPRFGRDLGGIRIHRGPAASAAASLVQAKAFALGPDVVFGSGHGEAATAVGDRLLAHEIAHVVQYADRGAARPAIRRQRLDPDAEGREAELEPTYDLEEQAELNKALGWRVKGTMPVVVNAEEPTALVVPADATYEEIASAIGNPAGATRTDWFEIVPAGHGPPPRAPDAKVVRIRDPALVSGVLATSITAELEARLKPDVALVADELKSWSLSPAVQWDLVKRTLVWGDRSDWKDQAGRSYFDKYLDQLENIELVEPDWYTFGLTSDRNSALGWLLDQSRQGFWMLRRMIEMRSSHHVSGATDIYKGANLAPGSPLGYAFVHERAATVTVVRRLAAASTMQQGLLEARNAPYLGLRVVIPSPEGVFYVYAVTLGLSSERSTLWLKQADFMTYGRGERYVFNFPGAAVVYPDSFSETQPVGGQAEKTSRAQILFDALSAAQEDPKAILGLDLDVLKEADTASRKEIFRIVLGKGIEEEGGLGLLARVILTTPAEEFFELEKLVITPSMVLRLAYQSGSGRMLLGRAFTMKALELRPLGAAALDQLPEFDVGRQGSTKWWVGVFAEEVQSQAIDPAAWDPQAATRIGQEPAVGGQAPGPVKQTGLRFRQDETFQPWYGFGADTKSAPKTEAYHPAQLVRVRFKDDGEELIVSAFELAMIGAVTDPWKEIFLPGAMKIANLWMMYAGARGAIGGFASSAAMTRGLAGTELAAAEQAAAELAQQTIRRLLYDLLVLGGSTAVNEYRQELNKTPAGRALVQLTDIAFLGLAVNDIYRLFSSGVLTKLITAAGRAIEELGTTAPQRLLEAYDTWRAAFSTLADFARRKLVRFAQTTTGHLSAVPVNEPGFIAAFRTARAELAGQRVLGGLTLAGRPTKTAEDVLARLRALAGDEEAFAAAFSAITRRAARLTPGDVNLFLNRVSALLNVRRGLAGKVGGLLVDAMRADDALVALAEGERLLANTGLSDEAVMVLAKKAGANRLDVAWFNELDLDVKKLDFIARDKGAPWRLFKRAWENPWNTELQEQAEKALRGYAGEMLAEELIPELLPRYRIASRQQKMGSSIIDFLLKEPGRLGRTPGLEVKAWHKDMWDAIGSGLYKRRVSHQAMEDVEALGLEWLDDLSTQLNNAKAATKAEPFLVMSNAATQRTINEMLIHFKAQGLKPQILQFDEAALDKLVKQLGLGLLGR